jgi:predicted HicB family RNase H-like nuclease
MPMPITEVTTDKKRISLYVDEELKADLELLAKTRKRSLSNLIEVICQEEVDKAKRGREIGSDDRP